MMRLVSPPMLARLSIVHDFHGNTSDNRHGLPRHQNPDQVLIDRAVAKVQGSANRPDYIHVKIQNRNATFLPLILSTSGRLHDEFVRLLYILAHRRALRCFEVLDYEPSHEELCQRRGSFFFEHRARIGLAAAHAAAIRVSGHHPPPTAMSSSFVPSSFAPDVFHFPDDEDLLYYLSSCVYVCVCFSLRVSFGFVLCAWVSAS